MFKNCVFGKKGFGNKNKLFCFWVVSLTLCSLPEAFLKTFLGNLDLEFHVNNIFVRDQED